MKDGKDYTVSVLKGTAISLVASLALVLIFAFIINIFALPDGAIKPINCAIKIIAVFLGCFLSVRGEGGFVKGMITGVISLILAYVLFGIIGGSFSIGISMLWEVLLGGVIGGASGAVAVNVRR